MKYCCYFYKSDGEKIIILLIKNKRTHCLNDLKIIWSLQEALKVIAGIILVLLLNEQRC